MTKKIAAPFEYDGFGFPIMLLNFPLKEIRGIQVPAIDYNLLQRNVLLALCSKPVPLTGNEIRFIRQYLEMTYKEFGKEFGMTHAAVINWEKSKNSFAKILPAMEICIRLCVLDVLKVKDKLFRETYKNFNHSNFKNQKNQKSDNYITIDSRSLTTV